MSQYTIAALPPLPGGTMTVGKAMNNQRQVVGVSDMLTPSGKREVHATLWSYDDKGLVGAPEDLGTLGGPHSEANAINNNGTAANSVIVGAADTLAGPSAFVRIPLTPVPHTIPLITGSAYGLNAGSTVVGSGWDGSRTRAFRWTFGSLVEFIAPAGSVARAVNDKEEVAGEMVLGPLASRPFFWSASTGFVDIGIAGSAQSINEAGVVVGGPDFVRMFDGAYRWQLATGVVRLPAPEGSISFASSVNESSDIVGHVAEKPDFEFRAFLWAEAGMYEDLNSRLDAQAQAEWHLQDASCINEFGEIAGYGYRVSTAQWLGYLLIPKPIERPRTPPPPTRSYEFGGEDDGPTIVIIPRPGPPPGPWVVVLREGVSARGISVLHARAGCVSNDGPSVAGAGPSSRGKASS